MHQRNTNQNNSEIISYTWKNVKDRKHWRQCMLENMWCTGISPPLLVWALTCTDPLNIIMAISQKIRKQSNSRPAIPFLGIYPNNAQSYHKDMCSTMFITALFVISITWKQPKCPLTNGQGKCVQKNVYTIVYRKKIWLLEICGQMGGSRKHNIEWGNPDPERQISYMLTHKWLLDIKKRKTSLWFTIPGNIYNNEDLKRDIYGFNLHGK